MSAAQAILADQARGAISPEIALARLLLLGTVPDPADLPPTVATLAEAHRDRLPGLAALARTGLDPLGDDQVAATAALFDRLAEEAPEAAVAFYTLGDPALLAAATAELATVIRRWATVDDAVLLDIGCGIGRVAVALAPFAREVIGLDLSAGMVARARENAAGCGNARFLVGGDGPIDLADGSVDVVVVADAMPFVVRAGDAVTGRLFADWARLLTPGGDLLVFNWSYRGDPARDVADAHALARAHGFDVVRAGERPFAIWDGVGFHLRRR